MNRIAVADLPRRGGETRVFEGSEHGGADVSFLIVELLPGDGPDLHSHPYVEVFLLREGRATFTVGDDRVEAEAGQIIVAPAGTPHRFFNSGEGVFCSVNIHPVGSMVTDWL